MIVGTPFFVTSICPERVAVGILTHRADTSGTCTLSNVTISVANTADRPCWMIANRNPVVVPVGGGVFDKIAFLLLVVCPDNNSGLSITPPLPVLVRITPLANAVALVVNRLNDCVNVCVADALAKST